MRTYDAGQVSDFLLSKSSPEQGDLISNLKLQTLLYYAAGVFAALRADTSRPLYGDALQAWQHGPVVPSQYQRFRRFGVEGIRSASTFDPSALDPHDLAVLEEVYSFYGQYAVWKLQLMAQHEPPWATSIQRVDKSITCMQLREYFLTEVEETYIASYHVKARSHEGVKQGLSWVTSWA